MLVTDTLPGSELLSNQGVGGLLLLIILGLVGWELRQADKRTKDAEKRATAADDTCRERLAELNAVWTARLAQERQDQETLQRLLAEARAETNRLAEKYAGTLETSRASALEANELVLLLRDQLRQRPP